MDKKYPPIVLRTIKCPYCLKKLDVEIEIDNDGVVGRGAWPVATDQKWLMEEDPERDEY